MKKPWGKKVIAIGIVLILFLVILFVILFGQDDKKTNQDPVKNQEQTDDDKDKDKEPEPTVVGQETETIKGEITDFKYGVKKQPVTYNTYDVYSDGSRKLVKSVDDILYHHSGYNATMEQMKAEGEIAVTTYMGYYEKLLELINKERQAVGVAPLTLDVNYCHVASFRAAEIEYSGRYSHERPDGSGCFAVTNFYKISYKRLAECIAQGQWTPNDVVKAWKKDATDYAYMIDKRFTKLGVGHSDAGIQKEWVALFVE